MASGCVKTQKLAERIEEYSNIHENLNVIDTIDFLESAIGNQFLLTFGPRTFSHSLVGKQSRAAGPEISAAGYERTIAN